MDTPKTLVFVVKRYAVRNAKLRPYAVRSLKVKQCAVRKGGGFTRLNVHMCRLNICSKTRLQHMNLNVEKKNNITLKHTDATD